ncbi:MAG TPA: carboxypeptidase-like regulatory domain-containing protein, partial [Flavisolibacter sp.]|nr:carboxypeptidase-like regulatory domain-containing protein [Flavisolibacter sp.]
MKQLFLIAAFISSSILSYAQTITGKVSDAGTNTPLSGATISISGKTATTTDRDGLFTIPCAPNTKITVSFVGYDSYQHTIKDCGEELRIRLRSASTNLNTVEITATSAQNKSILYQPASITKVNTYELKRGTGLFLDDAIATNVPGVTMNRRSVSGGQQFNIRGYGNGVRGTNGVSSNFDGQGYKVYLNGIPVTDAEGITLMDDIDFGSIGNVEVVKGPSGTLYGLAIAGVVNLKTLKPEPGKTSIGQEVIVGSYGLRRYTTRFEMGTENSSLLLNYGYQHSDGYMNHTASRKKFANAAGEFTINARQAVNFYAGYSDSYDERGGELTIAQYEAGDFSGNPAYIQRNAHSGITSFRLGVGHTYNFNQAISNTTTLYGTGISNNASSAAGWTDKAPINYGLRSTFDTRFTIGNGLSLSGITGIEVQRQNAQVTGYNMKADPA